MTIRFNLQNFNMLAGNYLYLLASPTKIDYSYASGFFLVPKEWNTFLLIWGTPLVEAPTKSLTVTPIYKDIITISYFLI